MPVLRAPAQARAALLDDPRAPQIPLCEGLFVAFADELPAGLRLLRRLDADLRRLTDAGLLRAAAAGLREKGPPRLIGDGPVRRFALDGDLDAGLMLLPELWPELLATLGGPAFAAPVGRGLLLVSAAAVPLAAAARAALPTAHHPLGAAVFAQAPGAGPSAPDGPPAWVPVHPVPESSA